MLVYSQQNGSTNASQPMQTQSATNQPSSQQSERDGQQDSQSQPQQPPAGQTMRLRDDPPPITPASRASRKRKTPPTNPSEQTQPPPQQPQPQQIQQPHPPPPGSVLVHHVLPPPHVMMHPQHLQGLPPFPQYAPTDYTPGGMPPPPPTADGQQQQTPQAAAASAPTANGGRTLSNSKRAEQNRKAQRAFRERRDQHVKALESRSQLLDAALASADEANRRWEECRALVDQLRVENAALRAALSQAQLLQPVAAEEAAKPSESAAASEAKSDVVEVTAEKQ